MNSWTKVSPYPCEGKHSVKGEGDSYTHVHTGLNTDKENMSGSCVFRAD